VSIKEIFFRYVGPILTIPAMIGALFIADWLLVWNGVRHARSLCADPGPLIIHDRALWELYSKPLRSQTLPLDYTAKRIAVRQLRERLGITMESSRISSNNPLLITADYSQIAIKYGKMPIAELNYYSARRISPIFEILFFADPGTKYGCGEERSYDFPEFY